MNARRQTSTPQMILKRQKDGVVAKGHAALLSWVKHDSTNQQHCLPNEEPTDELLIECLSPTLLIKECRRPRCNRIPVDGSKYCIRCKCHFPECTNKIQTRYHCRAHLTILGNGCAAKGCYLAKIPSSENCNKHQTNVGRPYIRNIAHPYDSELDSFMEEIDFNKLQ